LTGFAALFIEGAFAFGAGRVDFFWGLLAFFGTEERGEELRERDASFKEAESGSSLPRHLRTHAKRDTETGYHAIISMASAWSNRKYVN
jgi:hypothetical protein